MILKSNSKVTNMSSPQEITGKYYKVIVDWKRSNYVGIILVWDYAHGVLYMSVPAFVKKALNKYQHSTSSKPQDASTKAAPINYSAST